MLEKYQAAAVDNSSLSENLDRKANRKPPYSLLFTLGSPEEDPLTTGKGRLDFLVATDSHSAFWHGSLNF